MWPWLSGSTWQCSTEPYFDTSSTTSVAISFSQPGPFTASSSGTNMFLSSRYCVGMGDPGPSRPCCSATSGATTGPAAAAGFAAAAGAVCRPADVASLFMRAWREAAVSLRPPRISSTSSRSCGAPPASGPAAGPAAPAAPPMLATKLAARAAALSIPPVAPGIPRPGNVADGRPGSCVESSGGSADAPMASGCGSTPVGGCSSVPCCCCAACCAARAWSSSHCMLRSCSADLTHTGWPSSS
mmetsp:Transcript_32961/g.72855  ORF Transcript_32961/g.72855 Transcript_32961/m.72855 type:complete len:242 (-) Transcript_32961:681-1406(-)